MRDERVQEREQEWGTGGDRRKSLRKVSRPGQVPRRNIAYLWPLHQDLASEPLLFVNGRSPQNRCPGGPGTYYFLVTECQYNLRTRQAMLLLQLAYAEYCVQVWVSVFYEAN